MGCTERLKKRLASDEKTKDATISDAEKRYEWKKEAARREVRNAMR